MMFQCRVIKEKVLEFKRINCTIANGAAMKVFVTLYKANITDSIIYLMILIIYALFPDFFIKVHVIIRNKERLICYLVLKEFNNGSGIILERLTNSFSRYHNSHLM